MIANLTPQQAADAIGISKSTLAKLRLKGDGPNYLTIGKAILYRPDDIEEWMARRVFKSTSEYST